MSAGEKSCFLLEREVGEDQGDVDLIVQYYQLWSLYGGERSEIMFPGCACMVGPVSLHRQRMWDLGKKKKRLACRQQACIKCYILWNCHIFSQRAWVESPRKLIQDIAEADLTCGGDTWLALDSVVGSMPGFPLAWLSLHIPACPRGSGSSSHPQCQACPENHRGGETLSTKTEALLPRKIK